MDYRRNILYCSGECLSQDIPQHYKMHRGEKVRCIFSCASGWCYGCKDRVGKLHDELKLRKVKYTRVMYLRNKLKIEN